MPEIRKAESDNISTRIKAGDDCRVWHLRTGDVVLERVAPKLPDGKETRLGRQIDAVRHAHRRLVRRKDGSGSVLVLLDRMPDAVVWSDPAV